MYAKRLTARRPAKAKRQTGRRQMLEIACFLNVVLREWTDTVLRLSGMRALDIVRRAKRVAQTKQLASAAQYRDKLLAVKALLADSSRSPQTRIDEANALLAHLDETPLTQAAALREVLAQDQGRVRVILRHLAEFDPVSFPLST